MNNFQDIKEQMSLHEEKFEQVFSQSRKILKTSKKLINSVQRDDFEKAEENFNKINQEFVEIYDTANKDQKLLYSGPYKIAMQEYVEAIGFYELIKNGNLVSYNKLKVDAENYVMGICDLIGELVRWTINQVTKENYQAANKSKEITEEIYSNLLEIDFKNGEIRKKFDSIKYHLKKLEDITYELKLRDKI